LQFKLCNGANEEIEFAVGAVAILNAARKSKGLLPSPPWGRGWIATGAFTSRGETGEGVTDFASYG